jgi:DNA polymerase-3 subunit delta
MQKSAPPRDLLGELRRGELAPVYCLYGKERFLLARALDALRRAALEPATRDFNHDLVDARTTGAAHLVALARTLPMLGKRRLVEARGVEELRAEALDPLVAYLEQPAPETVLVLVAEKLDARGRLYTALKKRQALCSFEPPRERELYAFVVAEVRARGGSIDEPAARLLAEVVGADLGQLAQAVEKLSLYVGEGGRIGEDDVATCVTETRVRSVFELANAVGQGDRIEALRLLRRMLDERESPIGIVAMLARHFRQLAQVRELDQQRASKYDIASAIGVNPYFVEGLTSQARRLLPEALRQAFERLYEADTALKSSRVDDGILLERLVASLAG